MQDILDRDRDREGGVRGREDWLWPAEREDGGEVGPPGSGRHPTEPGGCWAAAAGAGELACQQLEIDHEV